MELVHSKSGRRNVNKVTGVKCGYLKTLGTRVKTWRPRWFVLDKDGQVRWYKKEDITEQSLGSFYNEDIVLKITPYKREFVRRDWQFEVMLPEKDKSISLRAESQEDMYSWMQAIDMYNGVNEANWVIDAIDECVDIVEYKRSTIEGLFEECVKDNLLFLLHCTTLKRGLELYMKTKKAEELILFWSQVEEYKDTCCHAIGSSSNRVRSRDSFTGVILDQDEARDRDYETMHAKAQDIFNTYIAKNGKYEICVDSKMRSKLHDLLIARETDGTMFDELQQQYFDMIKVTFYEAYLKSFIFQSLMLHVSFCEQQELVNRHYKDFLTYMDDAFYPDSYVPRIHPTPVKSLSLSSNNNNNTNNQNTRVRDSFTGVSIDEE